MVKVEEWTKKEIKEACSFWVLGNKIYEKCEEEGAKYSFTKNVKNIQDFKDWQEAFRNEIIDHLKIREMLESRGEIIIVKGDPKLSFDHGSYTIEHLYIKSWMDTLIPVYLSIPKQKNDEKIPAIVCTHGHTETKDILIGKKRRPWVWASTYAREYAKMGCITITMDQRGFGERKGPFLKKEDRYALIMLLYGFTINGLRFFDAIRQIDYLLTRDDVDPKRIGIAGLSMGGTTATFVAAIDTRVKLAAIAGYLTTFKGSIIDHKHCTCNYIPGILKLGELYDIFSLIAPRPVCFIAGKKDREFPISAAKLTFEKVKSAYRFLGAEENCVVDITPSGHGWRGNVAYPFVKKHFFEKK